MGTVIGGLGPGLGLSVNPFDANYERLLKIAELKREAVINNANNLSEYSKKKNDWVEVNLHNRDLGIPVTAIEDPPKVIHIDDAGVETFGPDYVTTKPSLPAPTGTLGSDGSIKSTSTAPNQLDQVLGGLTQMWNLLQGMKAEIDIIKAKLNG